MDPTLINNNQNGKKPMSCLPKIIIGFLILIVIGLIAIFGLLWMSNKRDEVMAQKTTTIESLPSTESLQPHLPRTIKYVGKDLLYAQITYTSDMGNYGIGFCDIQENCKTDSPSEFASVDIGRLGNLSDPLPSANDYPQEITLDNGIKAKATIDGLNLFFNGPINTVYVHLREPSSRNLAIIANIIIDSNLD